MGDIALEDQLMALSPVDGRYANTVDPLRPHLSEFGLIRSRVEVVAGWVGMLGLPGILPDRGPLSDVALDYLHTSIVEQFNSKDAQEIKDIEAKTNHDLNAVVRWLTGKMSGPDFNGYRELVHFGCTSEDVNSTAYALNVGRANELLVPKMDELALSLGDKSERWAEIALLALTHGQPATPTTMGKVLRVQEVRVREHRGKLARVRPAAKFSGATGSYNSMLFAYPEVDWPNITKRFIEERLGLHKTEITEQIEPHDWIARLAGEIAVGSAILQDLDVDMWLYISRGVVKQIPVASETGSSAMPHKVNPINFENSEGNSDMAIAIAEMLAKTLPRSRMQRDLSDSTRLRNLGNLFGHYYIAVASSIKALGRIAPNEQKISEELNSNWAILTEAVQTVLRRYGNEGAYDRIKDASRGFEFSENDYRSLVESLRDELPKEAFDSLMLLRPETYIGLAHELAR